MTHRLDLRFSFHCTCFLFLRLAAAFPVSRKSIITQASSTRFLDRLAPSICQGDIQRFTSEHPARNATRAKSCIQKTGDSCGRWGERFLGGRAMRRNVLFFFYYLRRFMSYERTPKLGTRTKEFQEVGYDSSTDGGRLALSLCLCDFFYCGFGGRSLALLFVKGTLLPG